MKPGKKMLVVIFAMIAAFILIAIFGIGDSIKGVTKMRFGIDIRGGVEAVFEPQNLDRQPTKEELDTAREVIEMRLDAQNIADRELTVDNDGGYIIVRFPWKSDETDFNPEDAIKELGEMAQLTFQNDAGEVLLEGKNIESSSVEKDDTGVSSEYVVKLSFDEEGAKKFQKITGEMIGQQLGIYMDGVEISAPQVQSEISGGEAVINGMADYQEAKLLSDKINSGALPFSLETSSFSTISPTLGSNALNIMIAAGITAFVLVCLFMLAFYRLPGVVACITLLFQMVLQLLAVSVAQYTLTLPGIAGIILSVGMSVDANIIISERISEELARGAVLRSAIKNGYKNAFSSVLDGNITTAIVAVILMIFGSGTMLSFGYTLLVGMLVNLFVGVTVSKQLLLSFCQYKAFQKLSLYHVKKEKKVKQFFQKKWICACISAVILVVGIFGVASNGVSLDTQFTGGVVLHYQVSQEMDLDEVQKEIEQVTKRSVMVQENKSNTEDIRYLEITLSGNSGLSPEEQKEITNTLQNQAKDTEITLSKTYAVEPYIGEKALKRSVEAVVVSFLFIMVYVWIRFSSMSGLSAGVTSIIALLHDVLVCFFVFVLFKIPLNDAFVAVLLTIIGYSINDTIVVYDRIRENRQKDETLNIIELINRSITQVLARSVNSSITTAICVLTILIAAIVYQIDSIFDFALPMFFGLISGCYSSVCIASVLWAMWKRRKDKS